MKGLALRREKLAADAVAGLINGVTSIPDAMASDILAGLSPVQGLYAIMSVPPWVR